MTETVIIVCTLWLVPLVGIIYSQIHNSIYLFLNDTQMQVVSYLSCDWILQMVTFLKTRPILWIKGIARTQSPTIKNYAFKLPTFGVIVGVILAEVQWQRLTLEEPPSWSRLTSTPGKYAYKLSLTTFEPWDLMMIKRKHIYASRNLVQICPQSSSTT